MSHGVLPGYGSSDVSIGIAGRVVPVMHLIAFWACQAGPLTTTMEHGGSSSGVSAWSAGRVVLVMCLAGFRLPGAGMLTATVEHRGGSAAPAGNPQEKRKTSRAGSTRRPLAHRGVTAVASCDRTPGHFRHRGPKPP